MPAWNKHHITTTFCDCFAEENFQLEYLIFSASNLWLIFDQFYDLANEEAAEKFITLATS